MINNTVKDLIIILHKTTDHLQWNQEVWTSSYKSSWVGMHEPSEMCTENMLTLATVSQLGV